MTEAIKAIIKLRCTIRSCASEVVIEGFTRELARDHAVVETGTEAPMRQLKSGLQVFLAIELPPFQQEAPRVLECGATLSRIRFVDGQARLELEIQSMAVSRTHYHRPCGSRDFAKGL